MNNTFDNGVPGASQDTLNDVFNNSELWSSQQSHNIDCNQNAALGQMQTQWSGGFGSGFEGN
jgi:hypothetical protein